MWNMLPFLSAGLHRDKRLDDVEAVRHNSCLTIHSAIIIEHNLRTHIRRNLAQIGTTRCWLCTDEKFSVRPLNRSVHPVVPNKPIEWCDCWGLPKVDSENGERPAIFHKSAPYGMSMWSKLAHIHGCFGEYVAYHATPLGRHWGDSLGIDNNIYIILG